MAERTAPLINGETPRPEREGYGEFALPPSWQFVALIAGADKTNWQDRFDEAVRDSRADAVAMTRDPFLMSLLNERARAVSARRWHIEVEDEQDERQLLIRDVTTRAMKRTKKLARMKKALVKWQIWFGRYAQQVKWGWTDVTVRQPAPNSRTNPTELDHFLETNPDSKAQAGPDVRPNVTRKALHIKSYSPVQGDKIGHQHDGTPYVLVNTARLNELPGAELVLTTLGKAVALKGSWRNRFVIHEYDGEDGDFFLQFDQAEAIHGVGERSTIYWLNYERLEMESWFSTFFERVGLGTNVWMYDGANPNALTEAKKAAQDHSQKNNLFVPVFPDSSGGRLRGAFERIETPTAGAEALRQAIKHKEEKIERQIVGQAGSARTEPGGFGGHQDEFQQQTKGDIARLDAEMFDDTWTSDVVCVMVRNTFPEWPDLWDCARHVTDLEAVDGEKKLQAIKLASDLGVKFIENQVRAITGMADPAAGDAVVGGKQTPDEGGKAGEAEEMPRGSAAAPSGWRLASHGPRGGKVWERNGRQYHGRKPPGGNQLNRDTDGTHFLGNDGAARSQPTSGAAIANAPLIPAAQVLNLVKDSPQFAGRNVDWEAYARKWGVVGDFYETVLSAETLSNWIETGKLKTEQRLDWRTVDRKTKERDYGVVVVTHEPKAALLCVDGNHSLVAALRNDEPNVRVILPVETEGGEAGGLALADHPIHLKRLDAARDAFLTSPGSRSWSDWFLIASATGQDVDCVQHLGEERLQELCVERGGNFYTFGRWLTLGGHGDPETGEKHKGGFRVFIEDDGTIEKGGPEGLRGKKVGDVKRHFDEVDRYKKIQERAKNPGPNPWGDGPLEEPGVEDELGVSPQSPKSPSELRTEQRQQLAEIYAAQVRTNGRVDFDQAKRILAGLEPMPGEGKGEGGGGSQETASAPTSATVESPPPSASVAPPVAPSMPSAAQVTKPKRESDREPLVRPMLEALKHLPPEDPDAAVLTRRLLKAGVSQEEIDRAHKPVATVDEGPKEEPKSQAKPEEPEEPGEPGEPEEPKTVAPKEPERREQPKLAAKPKSRTKPADKPVSAPAPATTDPLEGMDREQQLTALNRMGGASGAGVMGGSANEAARLAKEHVAAAMATPTPQEGKAWEAAVRAVTDRTTSNPFAPLTVPEVVEAMRRAVPELTRAQAQAALYRLNAAGKLALHPWTLSLDQFKGDPRDIMPLPGALGWTLKPGRG